MCQKSLVPFDTEIRIEFPPFQLYTYDYLLSDRFEMLFCSFTAKADNIQGNNQSDLDGKRLHV